MPYDTLEWSLTPVLQDSYGYDDQGNEILLGKHVYASVQPIVNGNLVNTPWVFDTMGVLVRQDPGYYLFDMFTCTCGIAGCAGIHDEVHVRVQNDVVQWQFPRLEPFLAAFVPAHFASADNALVWTFETQYYQQSLKALMDLLRNMEAEHSDIPLQLWPEDGVPNTKAREKLDAQLTKSQAWFMDSTAQTKDERAYWGPLYRADLVVDVEGTCFNLNVHNLLEIVCDKVVGTCDDEIDEELDALRAQWQEDQVAHFRHHPGELVELFKSMPWDTLREHGYILHADQDRLKALLACQWPNVQARLVEHEHPEQQDWTRL